MIQIIYTPPVAPQSLFPWEPVLVGWHSNLIIGIDTTIGYVLKKASGREHRFTF